MGVVVGVSLLFGCSGEESSVPLPDAPRALLGGTAADSPWPSDVFLHQGRLKVEGFAFAGNSLQRMTNALASLDGAPVRSSIFFSLDGPLPAAPGPLTERAQLFKLSGAAAPQRELELFYREATRELVAMTPAGLVLEEGARYACLVPRTLIAPSSAMQDALDGVGPFAAVYAPLLQEAAALGIELDQVGAATVFTVGRPSAKLFALRQQLEQTPAPTATVTRVIVGQELEELFGTPDTTRSGLGDPKGVVHDAIGAVVLGSFEAPFYQNNGPGRAGYIEFDTDGAARQHGTVSVPFLLALPATPPAGKVPLIIFQHGLNAGRIQVAAVANDAARAGFATIGVDALWHGERTPGSVDLVHNMTGQPGPDGLADLDAQGAMMHFFGFIGDSAAGIELFDARSIQDNFRQAVVELSQLVRLIKLGGLDQIANADAALAGLALDPDSLVYTSESFGSILGAELLAVEPGLEAGVLCVGGAGLVLPIFADSPYFSSILEFMFRAAFDKRVRFQEPEATPIYAQRSLSMIQAALEPGDPLVFARQIAVAPAETPKSLLLLQAYSDEIMPNQSGELLAAQCGATAIEVPGETRPLRYSELPSGTAPLSANHVGATVGLLNIYPATHGMYAGFTGEKRLEEGFPPTVHLSEPATIDNPTEWVRQMAIDFVVSTRQNEVPTITVSP